MLVMEKDNPLNKTEEPALPHVTKSAAIAASGLVVNINLLVATIIASITFAAAIQVPGGYDGTTGLANLRNKTSFKFFIAYDALAFSFPAASTLDLSMIELYPISSVMILTYTSIASSVLAFVMATKSMLE